MSPTTRTVLEDAGWRVGTLAAFFGFTEGQMARVERRARECVAAGTSTHGQRFVLAIVDARRAEGIPDEGGHATRDL